MMVMVKTACPIMSESDGRVCIPCGMVLESVGEEEPGEVWVEYAGSVYLLTSEEWEPA